MVLRSSVPIAVFAATMTLLGGCASAPDRPAPDLAPAPLAFRQRFLAELDHLELEQLYVLNPHARAPSEAPPSTSFFKGFAVVRQAEPAPIDRRQGRAHRGLRNIMNATSRVAAACFEPGHGARFRSQQGTFDVLVCFACNNYRIYGQTKTDVVGDSFETADAAPWLEAFQSAGLLPNAAAQRSP
jgi:hypothetical protein